jgi:hypothetical protein
VNRARISGKPIEEKWDKDQFGTEELKQLYRGKPYDAHEENFFRCIREGGLGVSDPYEGNPIRPVAKGYGVSRAVPYCCNVMVSAEY